MSAAPFRQFEKTGAYSTLVLSIWGLLALSWGACRVRSEDTNSSGPASRRPEPSAAPSISPAAVAPALSASASPSAAAPDELMVIAVGGIGTEPAQVESALAALQVARQAHASGASCLDGVVAAVETLEDDPALNAGTGAALRLDGSVELDAAVMTSSGKFGAVAGLASVRHPARVARAVADTPHKILSGQGATRFARLLGAEAFEVRTKEATRRYEMLIAPQGQGGAGGASADVVAWPTEGAGGAWELWRRYLPKARPAQPPETKATGGGSTSGGAATAASAPPPQPAPSSPRPPTAAAGGDTVAVLGRCAAGDFAAAASGGGPWLSLPGRVGDVPVPGAALYVGPKAAVFVTGSGERILEQMLARATYEKLLTSGSADDALAWALTDATPGELAVVIVDDHGVTVGPKGATSWAALAPTLRTSGEVP